MGAKNDLKKMVAIVVLVDPVKDHAKTQALVAYGLFCFYCSCKLDPLIICCGEYSASKKMMDYLVEDKEIDLLRVVVDETSPEMLAHSYRKLVEKTERLRGARVITITHNPLRTVYDFLLTRQIVHPQQCYHHAAD